MGNNASGKFQWDKNFNVLERNFNDHTLILEKFNGGQEYIGRQLISTDKKQSQQIKRLIKIKYHSNNPFLTKLQQVHHNSDEAYCSPEDKLYLIFVKPKQTLRQEILARKFANQPFTEQQADIILQSGAKAIRSLKEINHPHNNVSTSSIFIDSDRKILLGDPWMTPPVSHHGINQNVFACPSPQKILFQNDQIMNICPFRSDLFSLGTVVLEALNYEHMDILYEKGFRKLIEAKVKQKLSKIKNEQLRYKLSIVLSHDPQNREEIYKFYRPSFNSSQQTKQKLVRKQESEVKTTNERNSSDFNHKTSPIAELNREMLSYDRSANERIKMKINYQQPGQNIQQNNVQQNNVQQSNIQGGLGAYGNLQIRPPNTANMNTNTNTNAYTNVGFGNPYNLNYGKYNTDYNLKTNVMNMNSNHMAFPMTGNTQGNTNLGNTVIGNTNFGTSGGSTGLGNTSGGSGGGNITINFNNANYTQYRINGTPTNLNSKSPTTNTKNNENRAQNGQNFGITNLKMPSSDINYYKAYTNTSPLYEIGAKQNLTFNSNNIKNMDFIKAENIPRTATPKINIQDFKNSNHVFDRNKKDENHFVLTRQENANNFEPIMIGDSQQFVKTSGNIRYMENEPNKQLQNVETNIIHTGTYNIKTLHKTQSSQLPLVKTVETDYTQKENTKVTVKVQDPVTEVNQEREDKNYKRSGSGGGGNTPDRKPNKRYNSTIKEESDERSYSGSKNQQDLYEYVIETYEAGRYEGQKFNNMRNGFGKFYYKEGSVYEGQWRDNLMHGKGNLYYADGKLAYEGDWRMDQFHGNGKVYNQQQLQLKGNFDYTDFSDINDYWSSYEGQLNSDRRHGKGKIKLSNGEIFAGYFLADVVDGEGKFYTLNGQIVRGIWRNNKLIKKL